MDLDPGGSPAARPAERYARGMKDDVSTPATPGDGEEVDTFDVELEKRIHMFIADARPTDGPAPAG